MSAYIKLSTLEYPRHEGDIRLEHPDILESQTGNTFPCPDTYQLVQWVDAPTITEHQQAYEIAPVQQDGVWIMRWEVRNLTAAEIEHLQTVNIRNSVTVERI